MRQVEVKSQHVPPFILLQAVFEEAMREQCMNAAGVAQGSAAEVLARWGACLFAQLAALRPHRQPSHATLATWRVARAHFPINVSRLETCGCNATFGCLCSVATRRLLQMRRPQDDGSAVSRSCGMAEGRTPC